MTKAAQEANTTPQETGPLRCGLYVVATPIGNLKDITLRALETLQRVEVIACENTRFSSKLLQHYNIKTKQIAYNEHAGAKVRNRLLALLQQQKSIALISDAGTPLVSDPGYKLLQLCLENGIYVTTCPGSSAVMCALTLGGLPQDRFFFQGFLPQKGWRSILESLRPLKATLVFFESAKRLLKTLENCLSVFGDRPLIILREMTKTFEERTASTLQSFLNNPNITLKGEVTFLIGANKNSTTDQNLDKKIKALLGDHSVNEVATLLSHTEGLSKKALYTRALSLKK